MHLIKDVLGAGGPGLLIPVVLFGLVLYAARGLFGLHGRRNQSRTSSWSDGIRSELTTICG